jgi:hypothetical protein
MVHIFHVTIRLIKDVYKCFNSQTKTITIVSCLKCIQLFEIKIFALVFLDFEIDVKSKNISKSGRNKTTKPLYNLQITSNQKSLIM